MFYDEFLILLCLKTTCFLLANDHKRLLDTTDELHQVQVDLQNLKVNMVAVQSQVKSSKSNE